VLRYVTLEPGSAPPGRNRNAALKQVGAPFVAFTDDDCRPAPDWLERALAAARANPGAIIQGTTLPDPEEHVISRHAPWKATQTIRPPMPMAQTCNVVYPRDVLERLGGFDEKMSSGEDTELAERARGAGVPYEGAPEVLTWHAVHELGTVELLRWVWRWKDVPLLFKRHPRLRKEFPLYAFYSRAHVWLLVAVAGWLLGRRRPALTALALPYLVHRAPRYGSQPRARYRSLLELPVLFGADASEIAALAWGSVKHRSLFL
jgi:GT2 family glycosyltransferase